MNQKTLRFQNRYNNFKAEYSKLAPFLNISLNSASFEEKMQLCVAVKRIYEQAWKAMKYYLLEKGIVVLLPKKILMYYAKKFDIKPWLTLIDDLRDLALADDEASADKMITNCFKFYISAFEDFLKYFKIVTGEKLSTKSGLKLEQYPNKYVLDTYTTWILLNYFKTHTKVELVRIFGSRANGTFRCGSDINLFMDGKYSQKDFKKMVNELNLMRHPYFIEVVDVNNSDKQDLVDANLAASIPFYDKSDFS